jgi:hypothetical protein
MIATRVLPSERTSARTNKGSWTSPYGRAGVSVQFSIPGSGVMSARAMPARRLTLGVAGAAVAAEAIEPTAPRSASAAANKRLLIV